MKACYYLLCISAIALALTACDKGVCKDAWPGHFETADDVLRQVTGVSDCGYIISASGLLLKSTVIDSFETDYKYILNPVTGEQELQQSIELWGSGDFEECIDWKLSGNTYKIYHPDKFGPDTVVVKGAMITNF